jgi:hypothetical protein
MFSPFRKPRFISVVLSIILAFSLSFTIYALFIQTRFLRKREIGIAFLIWFLLSIILVFLLERFLFPRFKKFTLRGMILLLATSLIFAFWLINTTNHPPLFLMFPDNSLSINVPPSSVNQVEKRVVSIIWVTHDLGDVSFTQMEKTGEWEITEGAITHTGPGSASLRWQGRMGTNIKIELMKTPYSNPISIAWGDQMTSVNLAGQEGESLIVTHSFGSKQLFASFNFYIATAFLFLTITIPLLTLKIKRNPTPQKKYAWFFYVLPMIVVWGAYLIAFYPGMMQTDSNVQWGQIVTGQFIDYHPVFHTFLIWLITRIWYSPAAVVIFQILFLSFTVAWGIRVLEEHGFPRWSSWVLAALFAFAPLNGNMVIVLWKDIPYSTSLLLLSLMILKIVLSKGEWLNHRLSWVWLGIVSLFVSSFRHNGLPIPVVTLILLFACYRNFWKRITRSLVLFVVLYGLIHGPLYSYLKVETPQFGFLQQIMMHHISAHINKGQPLSSVENKLAASLIPSNQWGYNCCTALSIMFTPGYDDLKTSINGPIVQQLFLDLALKEPMVELKHLQCVSSIVWRSPGYCAANTLLPMTSTVWFDRNPGLNFFHEESLFPALRDFLATALISIRKDPLLTILIAPAIYLMVGIYATVIFSIRRRDRRGLLFILPLLIQEAILVLINVSDNFRYHYGAYLIGIFGIGLLIFALGEIIPEHTEKNV